MGRFLPVLLGAVENKESFTFHPAVWAVCAALFLAVLCLIWFLSPGLKSSSKRNTSNWVISLFALFLFGCAFYMILTDPKENADLAIGLAGLSLALLGFFDIRHMVQESISLQDVKEHAEKERTLCDCEALQKRSKWATDDWGRALGRSDGDDFTPIQRAVEDWMDYAMSWHGKVLSDSFKPNKKNKADRDKVLSTYTQFDALLTLDPAVEDIPGP